MLGLLPTSLNIDGVEYPIRSDFRSILSIFEAFNDKNLTDYEKSLVMLEILYIKQPTNLSQATEKAVWFINCGKQESKEENAPKTFDWEQDEQLIFSAVNNVAGKELRLCDNTHWWTFMGYFDCIGEGLFSTVISIRSKLAKGKRLEKHEQEFYRNHTDLIKLKSNYSDTEQEEINVLSSKLGLPII